jgi:hypothetical protein
LQSDRDGHTEELASVAAVAKVSQSVAAGAELRDAGLLDSTPEAS